MKRASFKKLKGIWAKEGGTSFNTVRELKAWRRALWFSFEKRLAKRSQHLQQKALPNARD